MTKHSSKCFWLYGAIGLAVLFTTGGYAYLHLERRALRIFCANLSIGTGISEIKKAALEQGFEPRVEDPAQMRIEPVGWRPLTPSCRVFFNGNRTVEYRIWQGT